MTQSTKVTEQVQKLEVDTIIELIQIDVIGTNTTLYITSGALNGSTFSFGGNTYSPIPFEARGFEVSGKGQMPRPVIKVANTNNIFSGLVSNFDDLVGSEIRRIRTLYRFLDNQPDADATATFPIDVFVVERKLTHNKLLVELELSAAIDQEDRKLPGRQVIRETCTHRYRSYDSEAGAFVYTNATCPYVASSYFTNLGVATGDPSRDMCGKRLSDCKRRFGNNAVLPTRAFPGTGKY
ncbi:phage minor tail protein L [uncultured Roseibium sp.]|uniref:phage minor tail protein L n=1 Tax=uncultured Roseibium sp. TaxID=1936171 RepID=UPI00262A99F9|nr:phage minor tail protein L [uncultured Roseibium sp.]